MQVYVFSKGFTSKYRSTYEYRKQIHRQAKILEDNHIAEQK